MEWWCSESASFILADVVVSSEAHTEAAGVRTVISAAIINFSVRFSGKTRELFEVCVIHKLAGVNGLFLACWSKRGGFSLLV